MSAYAPVCVCEQVFCVCAKTRQSDGGKSINESENVCACLRRFVRQCFGTVRTSGWFFNKTYKWHDTSEHVKNFIGRNKETWKLFLFSLHARKRGKTSSTHMYSIILRVYGCPSIILRSFYLNIYFAKCTDMHF